MKGVIGNEDSDGVGLRVIDNNDGSHGIHVAFDGEITYHEQDSYPDDPKKRTSEGNEHVNQARRYARYYVYKERGYESFPWDENIVRIEAVGDVIENLSTEEFEEHFGALYEAVAGSLTLDSGSGIGGLFAAIQGGASAHYIDIYLDDAGEIEKTSDVRPIVTSNDWQSELESPPEESDRVPDARIELTPIPIPSLELFQQVVVHQTNCQIRDRYVVMGEDPPEEYRLLGFGKYKFASLYQRDDLSMYRDYTRLDLDIPGYTVGLGLEDHPEIEGQVKELLSAFGNQ